MVQTGELESGLGDDDGRFGILLMKLACGIGAGDGDFDESGASMVIGCTNGPGYEVGRDVLVHIATVQ